MSRLSRAKAALRVQLERETGGTTRDTPRGAERLRFTKGCPISRNRHSLSVAFST